MFAWLLKILCQTFIAFDQNKIIYMTIFFFIVYHFQFKNWPITNNNCLLDSEEIFLNFSQSEARIAYGDDIFFTNRDEMKKSYRGPSIKARQFLFLIG
jgi:hypothetical protein